MGRSRQTLRNVLPAAFAGAALIVWAMFADVWPTAECRDASGCPGPGAATSTLIGSNTAPMPGESMVSDLVGSAVVDRRGERLGTVSDAVLDRDMRVVALAVKVGWVFGVPTRTVAVPIGSLHSPADAVPDAAGTDGHGEGGAAGEGSLAATLDALMAGGSPGRGVGRGGRLVSDLTRAQLLAAPTFRGR